MAENFLTVGLDDGHDHLKVYFGRDEKTGEPIQFKMHSRATFGRQNIGDDDDVNEERIEIGSDTYTVSENLTSFDSTQNDTYPTSDLSKALVYQALRLGLKNNNLNCRSLKITSGLPFNKFYNTTSSSRSKNQTLIEAKKLNLMNMDNVSNIYDNEKGIPKLNIISHTVLCEASAAYYDYLLDDDCKETQAGQNLGIYDGGAAVLDIGGRTTDCVVVNPNGNNINAQRSGTVNIGILTIYEEVRGRLREQHGWSYINEAALSESFKTGIYRLGQNSHNIREIIETAKYNMFKRIEHSINSTIGDGSDLPAIILAGGGSYFVKDLLCERYKNIVTPQDPEYANARGFYKVLKYYV